jgi:cell division protein ZapA
MNEETPISVQIMDSEYRVACPPNEKDALLAAAQYLNDTMRDIRETGKVAGAERIAVMAALNISYELLNTQRQTAQLENAVNQRLQQLMNNIETTLRKTKQKEL